MTGGGLLIGGRTVKVPGLEIINQSDAPWCVLDPGDYRMRKTRWPRQVVVHTTKGMWPQHVKPGRGRGGRDRVVADFWHRDPEHSATQLVVDNDGSIACLADLAYVCAYHATVSNDWSVGIEMYQEIDGGIHEATLDSTVVLVEAICREMSIPFTVVADPYRNAPLQRFLDGGPDFAGIYGHRNNTARRGAGDPGDEIVRRLVAAGAEPVLAEQREDIERGKARQAYLNGMGESLAVDGLAGPSSLAAARRRGFARWSDVPLA